MGSHKNRFTLNTPKENGQFEILRRHSESTVLKIVELVSSTRLPLGQRAFTAGGASFPLPGARNRSNNITLHSRHFEL